MHASPTWGLVPSRREKHSTELLDAAKEYFVSLIQDDLDNSDDVLFNECFDTVEGMTLGFVAGYEACLKARMPR